MPINYQRLFSNAVSALLSYVNDHCVNQLSNNIMYIKGYDHPNDLFEYELQAIKNRDYYKEEDIIKDILASLNNGLFLEYIDMILSYSTRKETIVFVNLWYSNTPVETTSKVGVHQIVENMGKTNKFNLNCYIHQRLKSAESKT